MATIPAIPQELIDNIIDHCFNDKHALAQCALVSPSWVPASRIHLFHEIVLEPVYSDLCREDILHATTHTRCAELCKLIVASPSLGNYIRSLSATDGSVSWSLLQRQLDYAQLSYHRIEGAKLLWFAHDAPNNLASLLTSLPSLDRLFLDGMFQDWASPSLRPLVEVVETKLTSGRPTHLRLEHWLFSTQLAFPRLLLKCHVLTSLELGDIRSSYSVGDDYNLFLYSELRDSELPNLETLIMHPQYYPQLIVALQAFSWPHLKRLTTHNFYTAPAVIRHCCESVEELQISFSSFTLELSLAIAACSRLRLLRVNDSISQFSIEANNPQVLEKNWDIFLAAVPTTIPLDTIVLVMDSVADQNPAGSQMWQLWTTYLDSVFTSAKFCALRQVILEVDELTLHSSSINVSDIRSWLPVLNSKVQLEINPRPNEE